MNASSNTRRVAGAAVAVTLAVVGGVAGSGSPTSADEPPPSIPAADPLSACTPGFWKNHLESWATTGLDPADTTGTAFDQAALYGFADETLLQLSDGGGGPGLDGGARILLRAAVASLLNSAVPDATFPLSTGDVVDAVNAALASADREQMLALAEELDELNNAGSCADGVDNSVGTRDGPPADVQRGRPTNLPPGPPIDVPQGPPAGVPQGPPAGVPQGPPAGVPQGPPAGVPQGPPAEVPDGPPADVPDGPPVDVPDGPPVDVPDGPPSG